MNIKELLNQGGNSLEKEVLLAHILGKSREFLISNSETEVTNEQATRYYNQIRSHERGEPVAYLINFKEFYGLPFFVDERVLIPRPETEFLVDKVIELTNYDPTVKKIIDVGTGSGNIAVSLAKHLPNHQIHASDLSDDALEVARINTKKNNVEVKFKKSDLLSEFQNERFDIIVANLPYIGEETNNFVSDETLEFEPHLALFGGHDGLQLYEKLFKQIKDFKYILGEIGYMHAKGLINLFEKYFPKLKCEILKDLAGLDRYFIINNN